MVRTRIAPSPTGYAHIGTIYQALFDYVLARKYNGQFIVRIEDTDRARFVEGAEDVVLDVLDWFDLTPDESPRTPAKKYEPYRQSERKDIGIYNTFMFGGNYKDNDYAGLLNTPLPMLDAATIDTNDQNNFCAYYCFCTKERLDEIRKSQQAKKEIVHYDKFCLRITRSEAEERKKNEEYVIRLNIPANHSITFDDLLVGKVEVSSRDIDDQVLLKSDGFPTYHFAVVVDDYLMDITHVFRGREWLPSTPKHIILYYYFNWVRPIYIHLPVILNMEGQGKLSKRHGHASATYYKELGYLPEAIINYLITIVWNHPEAKELFPLSEFIHLIHLNQLKGVETAYQNTNEGLKRILSLTKDFDENMFTTSQGPKFDLNKLTWMNQQYIQNLSDNDLKERIIAFFPKAKDLPESTFTGLLPILKTRMQTLKDFEGLTTIFFNQTKPELNEKEKEIAADLQKRFQEVTDWQEQTLFPIMKDLLTHYHERMSILYHILTGQDRGLPLPKVIELLGKGKTMEILENGIMN